MINTLSVKGVTRFLGVSRDQIYTLLHRGEPKGFRLGRRVLVLSDEIEALLGRVLDLNAEPSTRAEVARRSPILRTKPRSLLHNARPIYKLDLCPGCGRPWPENLERYSLERDGVKVVFCPRCGHEWEVAHAA